MRGRSAITIALMLGGCLLAAIPTRGDTERLKAPLETVPDAQPYLFTIPAPRGLILDRHGEVLARSRTIQRASLVLSELDLEDPDEASHFVLDTLSLIDDGEMLLGNLNYERLADHLEHRALLPLTFTHPLTEEQKTLLLESPLAEALRFETEYMRDYPAGKTACHVVGFVTREGPRPFGPVLPLEPLWPPVLGREGVESTLDDILKGDDGILNVLFEKDGEVRREQLIKEPKPGESLVLTLSLAMQKLAEKILVNYGRPGAVVAVDATSGDILALASNPGFDLSQFVDGISADAYAAIQQEDGDPFFPRAFAGQYPPGSTYKPIVSLAALHLGPIHGAATLYACGPTLEVSGRTFHNWNNSEFGYYDVRQAIMRSTNTWFYQAGINTGSTSILQTSKLFGLGVKPMVPLDNVALGNLPGDVAGNRAVANLSIGQGALLVSPLQMALAMGGLANGSYLPAPRLVLQTQTPPPTEKVVRITSTARGQTFPYRSSDMRLVHQGMWGVVNSERGTGGRARMDWPQVYGKTGTAEWTNEGEERTLSWFTGFVNAFNPRIAFAVVCEGKKGESLSGGKVAAPMAGEFLRAIYGNPKTYQEVIPSRPANLPIVYYQNPPTYQAIPAFRRYRPPVNTERRRSRSNFPSGWGFRR